MAGRMPWFDWQAAIARAEAILAAPPAKPWVRRAEASGDLVARFALPVELCKPMNAVARRRGAVVAAPWAITQMKQRCFEAMSLQLLVQGLRPGGPALEGRPQVRCVRFSMRPTDAYADWAKNPVDRLCRGKRGLGLLFDDRPERCDLWQWCEPARPKEGFAYVEVRTG